jgi:nucleotide-binding universal stress UspA family protein
VTSSPSAVLVGHDGSPAADTALRWALDAAACSGSRVDVLCAWDLDTAALVSPVPPGPEDLSSLAKAAQAGTEDAVARVLPTVPAASTVPVQVLVERGSPARVLAQRSRHDDTRLLVVGRRGSGALRQLLGSTTSAALRSSACPVAVVPPAHDPVGGPPRAVVGWDGSASARRALAWAARHAADAGLELQVVVGWQVTSLHHAVVSDLAVVPPLSAYEEIAAGQAEAGAALARQHAGARLDPERVTALAVHRPPAAALLDAARSARLVVVGSRGRGGFAGLVLGSTSDQVSRHAPCPVVVVRDASDLAEDHAPIPRSDPS